MATDPPIGTKIKKRRQILGMTQQELAGELGVSKSTVANWESGKHFPLRYLGKVEDVLGVSLDGGSQDAPEYDDPDLQQVWEASDGLPDGARRELVRLAGKMRAAQHGGAGRRA